jgi:ribosome-binding factor A
MSETLRCKRVASLIKEELAAFLIGAVQEQGSGFISVTRVEVTADLMSARVFLSIFGVEDKTVLLEKIEKRKGRIRKELASRVKLKYNPQLVFCMDPTPEYEEKLDQLIEKTRIS